MGKALANVLKYNFFIPFFWALLQRAMFSSGFHHDSKNFERIERKPRMRNSANKHKLV